MIEKFFKFPTPKPRLIRITGAKRTYAGGILTTFYSSTTVEHPNTSSSGSNPVDSYGPLVFGPKNADAPTKWPAIEASGSATVPTDGSVVVLAWPSPTQDFLIFMYPRKRFARIDAKKTSGSTTWYTWTEMEPGPRVTAGPTWTVKADGLTGTEESGPILRNPLFEINQNVSVPADGSVVVPIIEYPERIDTGADAGYLRERPEATVEETQHANGTTLHTIQEIVWAGALGGEFALEIYDSSGNHATSDPIDYTDNNTDIETAIIASGLATACTVVGTGASFTVEFTDNFLHWPRVWVDASGMWSDTPYFFDGSGVGVGTSYPNLQWNWQPIQGTAGSYQINRNEAVPVSALSAETIAFTAPATPSANDVFMIEILRTNLGTVRLYAPPLYDGVTSTSEVLTDGIPSPDPGWGSWVFTYSGTVDVGWVTSRARPS